MTQRISPALLIQRRAPRSSNHEGHEIHEGQYFWPSWASRLRGLQTGTPNLQRPTPKVNASLGFGTWDLGFAKNGAPDRIRTCGLQLRRLPLYPAELRAPLGERRKFKSKVQKLDVSRRLEAGSTNVTLLRTLTSHFELRANCVWRARQDSNLRPTDSKSGALSN